MKDQTTTDDTLLHDDFLNYPDAARFLGVRLNTLYGWVHDKSVPHFRLTGRCVRFSRAALRAWLAAKAVPATGNAVTQ